MRGGARSFSGRLSVSVIWRDDDVLQPETRVADLLAVDDLLRAHECQHTIAILASTLTPDLATVIKERGMVPQLHGWAHDDLSVDDAAVAQLPRALETIAAACGHRPTVLYPPWNRVSPRLLEAAAKLDLVVSWEKLSLTPFIRRQGRCRPGTVLNFHYWHEPDRIALATALELYANGDRGLA